MPRVTLRLGFVAACLAGTLCCSLDERTLAAAPESGQEAAAADLDGVGGLALGVACRQGRQCLSGACFDGVCCDAVCDSVCGACDSPGNVGRCTTIELGCDVAAADGSGGGLPPPAAAAAPVAAAPAPDGGECSDGDSVDCGTLQGGVGACAAAVAGCSGGRWSREACEPTSAELCDASFQDENCNGQTNESPPCETFASISGGVNYLCGVSTGGRVLCWGVNGAGQLGDGSLIDRDVPTEVAGLGTDTRSVVAGGTTTCAISNAGNVSCWGEQLHLVQGGTSGASLTPVPATLFPPVLALAVQSSRVCAILPGQTLACSATDPVSPEAGVLGIAPLAGFEGIQAIGEGDVGLCGLIADGSVRCWSGSPADAPVAVPGLTGAVYIAGDYRAACAIVAGGSVRCWGGQFGYTALGQATDPGPMGLVTVPGVSGAIAIFTTSTKGCALSAGGTVQCWGFGAEAEFARLAALQNVDLLATPLFGERVFVRTASGEVFGFSPVNRGQLPMNGNPTSGGDGPYRLMGP